MTLYDITRQKPMSELWRIPDPENEYVLGLILHDLAVPVEPTDRICITHRTMTAIGHNHCYTNLDRDKCVMVDVVRVGDSDG